MPVGGGGAAVAVGTGLGVVVATGVRVGVGLGVAIGRGVGVGMGLVVAVGTGVRVGVGAGVSVGEGVAVTLIITRVGSGPKPIPRWDMHCGGIDDDRKDATALHITFRPQLSEHRQCGLSICTFHLGFSLVASLRSVPPNIHRSGVHCSAGPRCAMLAYSSRSV